MKKIFSVKVSPRSSYKEVIRVSESELKVRLTAAPTDGEANKQLVVLLSKEFGVPKSKITIVKGQTSRNKLVAFE